MVEPTPPGSVVVSDTGATSGRRVKERKHCRVEFDKLNASFRRDRSGSIIAGFRWGGGGGGTR